MINLSSAMKVKIFDEFFHNFTEPSFGSLPKKEVELLIFRLLIDANSFGLKPDMQSISRELRIPISKVKTLYYEMQLRTVVYTDESLRDEIFAALKKARIYVVHKKVRVEIGIEDSLLRNEIESRIKGFGGFPDYSFNRELVRFDGNTYTLLIESFTNLEQRKNLEAAILQVLKESEKSINGDPAFKELLGIFLRAVSEKAGDEAGKKIVDLSFGLITGGLSNLIDAVRICM